MERRLADMTALISAIGARLRTLYADALNGKIPKKMAELATQLDHGILGSDQRAAHPANAKRLASG
jgi:hypothetical protein